MNMKNVMDFFKHEWLKITIIALFLVSFLVSFLFVILFSDPVAMGSFYVPVTLISLPIFCIYLPLILTGVMVGAQTLPSWIIILFYTYFVSSLIVFIYNKFKNKKKILALLVLVYAVAVAGFAYMYIDSSLGGVKVGEAISIISAKCVDGYHIIFIKNVGDSERNVTLELIKIKIDDMEPAPFSCSLNPEDGTGAVCVSNAGTDAGQHNITVYARANSVRAVDIC